MDLARKIGIAVVLIIPAFLLGGAVWALLGSFSAVLGWLAVLCVLVGMAIIYSFIITGRCLGACQRT
ncbi:MAG: hypothetical protein V1689_14780 [Pseudomonadota bacterium]